MADLDTPQDMRNPPKDLDPWLVWHISQIHSGVKQNTKQIEALDHKVDRIDERLREEIKRSTSADNEHDRRLDDLNHWRNNIAGPTGQHHHDKPPSNPSPPGASAAANAVTFKWLAEKLAAPVVIYIITAIIALVVARLASGW